MSLLTDFAEAQFQNARVVIGGEDLTVGTGEAVSAVLNDVQAYHDEYAPGGFNLIQSCTAVVSKTEWAAKYPAEVTSYQKKTATLRNQTLRVDRISDGQAFVTITLKTARKG